MLYESCNLINAEATAAQCRWMNCAQIDLKCRRYHARHAAQAAQVGGDPAAAPILLSRAAQIDVAGREVSASRSLINTSIATPSHVRSLPFAFQ